MPKRIWKLLGHYRIAYFFAGSELAMAVSRGRFDLVTASFLALMVLLLLSGYRNEEIGCSAEVRNAG